MNRKGISAIVATATLRALFAFRFSRVAVGGEWRMKKRGISAIVATVLIILITVAGVSIIWVGILPMISESLEFSALDGRVSVVGAGGYTLYDADREIASVQVRREPDEGVMNRIVVSFLIDGNSVSSSVVAPPSGGVKTYSFDLASVGVPESVEVAPIFASSKGNEKVGAVTSKAKISSGAIDSIRGNVYGIGGDYVSEVPTDGLISFWTFSGDAGDGWGESDGTLVGDAQVVGGELVLDGSGDYVEGGVTQISTNGPATISGWFNSNDDVFSRGSSIYWYNGFLYQHSANNYLYFYGSSSLFYWAPSLNTWYHVLITYDGTGTGKLYIDGEFNRDVTSQASADVPPFSGSIGGSFDGKVDNVMVYNRVISPEEIAMIYEVQKKD